MLLLVERFAVGRTGVRQKTVRWKARKRPDDLDFNQDLIFSLNLKCKWDYFVEKNMHLTHIFKCVKDSLVTYLPRPCLILSRNYLCASHKSLIFLYISDNIATIIERRKKRYPLLVCSLSTQFCTDQILQSELKENLK